jgi:hypothetical protein
VRRPPAVLAAAARRPAGFGDRREYTVSPELLGDLVRVVDCGVAGELAGNAARSGDVPSGGYCLAVQAGAARACLGDAAALNGRQGGYAAAWECTRGLGRRARQGEAGTAAQRPRPARRPARGAADASASARAREAPGRPWHGGTAAQRPATVSALRSTGRGVEHDVVRPGSTVTV